MTCRSSSIQDPAVSFHSHNKPGRTFFCCAGLGLILLVAAVGGLGQSGTKPLPPIDPQKVQDQDTMTWDDYRPIPGKNWADPSLKPERPFRLAVVGIDFPDQPFVITLPKGSDPFGNPQIDPIPRAQAPQFYADFFTKPSKVNHGQTITGYLMEQSRGKAGITEVKAFGPYRMPKPLSHAKARRTRSHLRALRVFACCRTYVETI